MSAVAALVYVCHDAVAVPSVFYESTIAYRKNAVSIPFRHSHAGHLERCFLPSSRLGRECFRIRLPMCIALSVF